MDVKLMKKKLYQARQTIDECIQDIDKLYKTNSASVVKSRKQTVNKIVGINQIKFGSNLRNFINEYVRYANNGEKKFTLLLAFITKGKTHVEINLTDSVKAWNKVSAKDLLGKYNRKYPTTAKANGWINSPKTGYYYLDEKWGEIFNK